jgi:tRNA(Ile)-lysidine synthase
MTLARALVSGEGCAPVRAQEFAYFMDRFAPWEKAPHLAVGLSGGSDSFALTLLARDWARARGGRVTALTVDHGLRAESAAEAQAVAARCAALGIEQQVLRWTGERPRSGIQAAARAARYRLLEDWCATNRVLHLLLGHQREDQAETTLMRLERRSGVAGLAGMAACVEHRAVRVVRPLLSVSRMRLRATLTAAGEGWIDDPSNANPAFTRPRLRAALASGAESAAIERLLGIAGQAAASRRALEAKTAALLACAASLDPAGFVWLDPEAMRAAPEPVGLTALAAVIATVSGADYPPRFGQLARLYQSLPAAGGQTLGGCLIAPRRGRLLVCREPAAVAPAVALAAGGAARWDRRFAATLAAAAGTELMLGALGADAQGMGGKAPEAALAQIPPVARPALAALRLGSEVAAVPALGYFSGRRAARPGLLHVLFRPTRPLTAAGFTIV